jgi:hypothetical protein
MRIAHAALIGATLMLVPQPAKAQSVAASFTQFQARLGEAAAAKPSQEQLLSRISQDAFALQIASPKIKTTDAPDFARSLSYNAELLAEASRASDEDAAAILVDVSDDLEVKRSAAASMGISSSFPGRVRVRVSTLRNGQAVAGYVVTLNTVRWQAGQPMYRLPNLSPAAGEVTPGRYLVSAILNGLVMASDVFRVGLSAEDETKIELPVP